MNTFTFGTFKAVMDVSDVNQEAYSFILRTIFQYMLKVHSIDIDNYIDYSDITSTTVIIPPEDLQYAIFKHAKHLFDVQSKGTDNVDSVKDSGGNTVKYREPKLPSMITSTYRMYSPIEPVIL